jgi:hypothetical protein
MSKVNHGQLTRKPQPPPTRGSNRQPRAKRRFTLPGKDKRNDQINPRRASETRRS